ncbi:MAG: histidine kinase [Gemmatimonadales bacterium]|nr:histidine kinase [Gemmatimonadota bacterium]MCC7133052.1 histidine kinase [Gemmatimonadales bacterium]MDX2058693.1 histidine kinase [Gemmatimonadales bacterium]
MATDTRPLSVRPLLIGATVLALLTSAQHWAVMQIEANQPSWRTVQHALSKEGPVWYLWVLASPLVAWMVRTVPFRAGRLHRSIPLHVLFALGMVLVHQAALLATYRLVGFPSGTRPFFATLVQGLPFRMTIGLLGYAVLFGAVLAADYYQRFRERELAAAALREQLAEAKLQALRMQLNPHFLFNAMNTIAMLVRSQSNAEAVRMLAGLSGILRQVLVESPPQESRLADELAFIGKYLEIEKARFPDRLVVESTIDPEVEEALVPTWILQPLVENAVRHGVARRAAAGRIEIRGTRRGADLVLEVRDDGPGLAGTPDVVTPASGIPLSTGGIGIANTRSRLTQLYGERGRLELLSPPEGGTTARVTMPFRLGARAVELEAVGAG